MKILYIQKIITWFQIACRTHEYYWSNDSKTSNSINEITIKFDDSWDTESRAELIKRISVLYKYKDGKIFLQHDQDTAWNAIVEYWNKQGIENVQNHVTLVLKANRTYFIDDQGKKSKTYCEANGMDWFQESENRIPWFQWIP